MDATAELLQRIEDLEKALKLHRGPNPGGTSLNRPHTNIPYLNSEGEIEVTQLPTGTGSDEVALGDHTHAAPEETVWGFYL